MKSRWYCSKPAEFNGVIPITREECEKIKGQNGQTGEWKESPANGRNVPICHETQYTRDNHLVNLIDQDHNINLNKILFIFFYSVKGNTFGGNAPSFNWTIPDEFNERCVLRLRNNVSTGDYDRWTVNANNLTSTKIFSKLDS